MKPATLVAFSILTALLTFACVGIEIGTPDDATSGNGTPYVAGTVIAGFGKLEPFDNFEDAEAKLGWRTMRPTDPRFHLVQQGGLLRTFPEIGLPRLEQAYSIEGAGMVSVFITQAPEAYALRTSGTMKRTKMGPFDGELWGELPHASYIFFSGERISDQRIRVKVHTNQSSDLSEEDFIAFVASLAFAEPTPVADLPILPSTETP